MSNKTFCFKDNESKGAKNSKERIIVAFLTNAIGEKENILVIGKSAKPRCFKNLDIKRLPVYYYNNKKAWMTSKIFEDFFLKN